MTPILYDTFDRFVRDSLGTSESGHTYDTTGALFSVDGSCAFTTQYGSDGDSVAVAECGQANVRIRGHAKFRTPTAMLLVGRWQADNDAVYALVSNGFCSIYKNDGGAVTNLATTQLEIPDGAVVELVLSGTSIKLLVNGIRILPVVSSDHNQSATKHGFCLYDFMARLENFEVHTA